MRPEFVYFDLGNVLCLFNHAKSVANMARLAETSENAMREIVYLSDLEHRYESGLVTGEEFVQEIADKLGKESLDTDAMLEAASDMFCPNDAILPVLDRICEMNIPLGILSNTCDAHWNWIVKQNYPQLNYPFKPVVLSFEVKAMKPLEDIYRISTEIAGFPKESIFFTDDRLDNIEAANRFGWSTSQFIDADQLMNVVDRWK